MGFILGGFSPEASFAAGGVLSVVGGVTLKKYHKRSQILFSLIPLLFAIQQLAEGFLWLNLNYQNLFLKIAKYVFLFFALLLWPGYFGFSILPMEPHAKRRKILYLFGFMGVGVALYLLYWIIHFKGVPVEACENHINYVFVYPYKPQVGYLYAACILIPCFITSVKRVWILGLLLGVGFFYTRLFFALKYLISIWCFLAAISSIVVYYILYLHGKNMRVAAETAPKK